jgi:hypothetical protein
MSDCFIGLRKVKGLMNPENGKKLDFDRSLGHITAIPL